MIITIAGMPGAGKTSIAKLLAKRLGMQFYSIGDLLGKMAVEQNTTIDEFLRRGEEADRIVDEYQKKLAETEDNLIIEGKISWFLIPQSFKILVAVDPDEGARRIYEDKKAGGHRPDEPNYESVEQLKKILADRVQLYVDKFKKLYGVDDFFDQSHFDSVLDTTNATGPAENADRIMTVLRDRGLIH